MKRKMLCGVLAAAVCLSATGLGLASTGKTTAKASETEYKTVYDFTSVTDVASVTDFSVGIDPKDNSTDLGYTSDGWVTYQKAMADIFKADNGLRVKTEKYSGDGVSENNLYVRLNVKKAAYFKAELVYTYNAEDRNGWAGFMFGYSNYDRKARWPDSPNGVEMFVQKEGKGTYSSQKFKGLKGSEYIEGIAPENWQIVGEHVLSVTVNENELALTADGTQVVSVSKEEMAAANYQVSNESFGFYLTNGDFTVKKFSYSLTDENGEVTDVRATGIDVADTAEVTQYEPLDLNAKVIPADAAVKTLLYEVPEGAAEKNGKIFFGKPGTYDVTVRSADVESVYKTVKVTVKANEKFATYGTTAEDAAKNFEHYVVTTGGAKDGHQADVADYWTFEDNGAMTLTQNIKSGVDSGYSLLYLKDLVNGLALNANCFEIDYMVKTNNAPNGWHGIGFALADRSTVPNQDGISVFIQEEARKATIWGSGKAGVSGPYEVDSAYARGEWNFVRVAVYGENGEFVIKMYVNDLTAPAVEVKAGAIPAGDIALFTTTVISLRDVSFVRLDEKGNRIETVYPSEVKVLNEKKTAEVGETWDIQACVLPENATDKGLFFESSDALIATVTAEGKVSFRNAGKVTITIKCAGDPAIKTAVEVAVKAKEVKPTSITFDATPSADKTVVGGKYTLFVTVLPGDATNQNVLFSSSDETVATVDANGRITFLKAGNVTITVTAEADPSVKNSIELTVTGGETPVESGSGNDSGSGSTSTGKTGCGGAVSGLAGLGALIALAAAVVVKKNKE
ncbi:MAG: Ig-like domain-containing protein [Clostridia bacterium]|nr:Ig-like domain-containing protein [Clostridia bacterium]